jgi:hypothetical protein
VVRALARRCRYFDHHQAGELPRHPNLKTFIDTAPDVCTSLIVDRYLTGRQRIWAVVAAFGDNLNESARRAAEPLKLPPPEIELLRELGVCINYNAYGDSVDDLPYHPADLFEAVSFTGNRATSSARPIYGVLNIGTISGRRGIRPTASFAFADTAWSRRINGVFGNRLAHPARAHAVLVARGGGYLVGVRAPRRVPSGRTSVPEVRGGGAGRRDQSPATELTFHQRVLRQFG